MNDDLIVIDTYMREQAIRAVADAIRAQQGQLVPMPEGQQALSAPVTYPPAREAITVHPVPIDGYSEPAGWWERHWHHVAVSSGVAGVVGLFVWAVIRLLTRAVSAAAGMAPSLGGIALVVLLVAWLCSRGGGGGRSFSGTFEGKMH